MADRKISQLDPTALLLGDELIPIVQPVDDPKGNKKITIDQLMELAPVQSVNGDTGDVTVTPDNIGASKPGDNISVFTNDAGYITAGGVVYDLVSPSNVTVGGLPAGTALTGRTLKSILEEILVDYLLPAFSSGVMSGQATAVEVGTTISGSKTFTWSTTNSGNVAANSIIIRDVTGGNVDLATGLANDGTESVAIVSVQKTSATSHTWRILATNTQSGSFQIDFIVSWRWRIYTGTSVSVTLDAAAIAALVTQSLATGLTGTYSFAAGGYKYFVWDDSFGSPTAATGFKDTSTNLAVAMADSSDDAAYSNVQNGWSYALVSVTAVGVTSNKRVYRTRNQLGGSISIAVS